MAEKNKTKNHLLSELYLCMSSFIIKKSSFEIEFEFDFIIRLMMDKISEDCNIMYDLKFIVLIIIHRKEIIIVI